MVENILNLTRLQEGRLTLQKKPEAVEEIIGSAILHLQKRAPGREISVSVPEALLIAPMDARLMEQVLVNLLDNAVKHTPPDQEISVSAAQVGTNAVITISDQGSGIAQKDLPHIFEMFYTTQGVTADAVKGVGIGLPICQAIVHAHGGDIVAENRKNGGAVFTVTLPMEGEKKQWLNHRQRSSSSRTILRSGALSLMP